MAWLNMMISNGTIKEIGNSTLTSENYGTYYLFKTSASSPQEPLQCGVLTQIISTQSDNGGGRYGHYTTTEVTIFVFYDPVTKKEIRTRESPRPAIYLLPDTLPTSDPRLPKTLPPGGLPTPQQMAWLNMMISNGTIKEIGNSTLTSENYGTYYLFKTSASSPEEPLQCGVLTQIISTQIGNGGNYGPDNTTEVTIFVFYDPVTNKEIRTRERPRPGIYLIPDTLPTSDPIIPKTLPPGGLPTPQQMAWLNMMIESGDIREVSSKLTEANYNTYYLFKTKPNGILQGGFLSKIVSYGKTQRGWFEGVFEERDYTVIQYVFYDPITKQEIETDEQKESELRPMYSLPDILPTSEPRSGIFKRIIDVDDVTGNMTFYDDGNGSNTYAIPTNSNWTGMCIVEIDPQSGGNHNMLDANLLCSSIQKGFTGKIITTMLVEKMCGKRHPANESSESALSEEVRNTNKMKRESVKREIYVKVRVVSPNNPVLNRTGMNLADIEELHKIREKTKDVIKTQGSNLCVTRAKPHDKVLGPGLEDLAPVSDDELESLLGRRTDFYGRFGEFAVKVRLASNKRPFRICSLLDGITLKNLESDDYLLVTRDFRRVFQTSVDNSKKLFQSNLKKRISPAKKGDIVYFYKPKDTNKEYPLYGKVEVVNSETYVVKKKIFGKDVMGEKNHKYDIKYTDKEIDDEVTEKGVTQLYEPDVENIDDERNKEPISQDLPFNLSPSAHFINTRGGKKNIKRTAKRKQRKLNGRKKTRRSVYQSRKSIKRKMRSKLPRRITHRTRRNKQIKTIKHK